MVVITDNAILADAVRNLYDQAVVVLPGLRDVGFNAFYRRTVFDTVPNPDVRIVRIERGRDTGKLTLEQRAGRDYKPVPGIVPASYHDFIAQHPDLASAVKAYLASQN